MNADGRLSIIHLLHRSRHIDSIDSIRSESITKFSCHADDACWPFKSHTKMVASIIYVTLYVVGMQAHDHVTCNASMLPLTASAMLMTLLRCITICSISAPKKSHLTISAAGEDPGLGWVKSAAENSFMAKLLMPPQDLDRNDQRICQQVLQSRSKLCSEIHESTVSAPHIQVCREHEQGVNIVGSLNSSSGLAVFGAWPSLKVL